MDLCGDKMGISYDVNYKTKTSSTVQEFAFSSKVQTMLDEPKDQMEHPKPSV